MANILKISDACSLAFHSLGLMASCPGNPERLLTTHEIAKTFHASEAHLSKVLQRLAKAELVRSTRGPHGGFSLAKPPVNISLLTIYELIDGPLPERYCLMGTPICQGQNCILGDLLENITNQVKNYLNRTTIADLIKVYNITGDTNKLAAPQK